MNQEELEFRLAGIGGSDAPVVMEKSPWKTPFELWQEKTQRKFPSPATFPMIRGRELEPIARKAYEEEREVEMPADRAVHPDIDYVRCNMDGVNWDLGRALEIKVAGKDDHRLATKGLIPVKYWYQCAHICAAADLPECDYFSYHVDRKTGRVSTATVLFRRNKKTEDRMLAKEAQFWEYVQTDTEPPQSEPKKEGIFQIRKNRMPIKKTTILKPRPSLVTPKEDLVVIEPTDMSNIIEILRMAKEMNAKVKVEMVFDLGGK